MKHDPELNVLRVVRGPSDAFAEHAESALRIWWLRDTGHAARLGVRGRRGQDGCAAGGLLRTSWRGQRWLAGREGHVKAPRDGRAQAKGGYR